MCELITKLQPAEERKARAVDASIPDPDVGGYDIIVACSSGGKDSEVTLDLLAELCRQADVLDRLVVLHSDLGRQEWPGVPELAERQAARYGVPFRKCSRIGQVCRQKPKNAEGVPLYEIGETYGDLLDHMWHRLRQDQKRGRKVPVIPDQANRWCTGDHKTKPCERAITALVAEWHERNPNAGRPCRVLECLGLRAQESPKRAKQPRLTARKRNGRQHVDTYLPIKWWTHAQIWSHIREQDLEYHPAYDLGLPRLSCVLCVFANKAALRLAGYHNRELLREFVEFEQANKAWSGHTWRKGFELASIERDLDEGWTPEEGQPIEGWAA